MSLLSTSRFYHFFQTKYLPFVSYGGACPFSLLNKTQTFLLIPFAIENFKSYEKALKETLNSEKKLKFGI